MENQLQSFNSEAEGDLTSEESHRREENNNNSIEQNTGKDCLVL